MKYKREIKVAVLAIVSLFLLYFGFNFLKGVNVFHPVCAYHARYTNLSGLVEQAPVFIRGYKVGQVDQISYDFTRDTAFTVSISVSRDIRLPKGTTLNIIQNGLLGGPAMELRLAPASDDCFADGDWLPAAVVPGLLDQVQGDLMAKVSSAISAIDSLVSNVNSQLADNHLYEILYQVDSIAGDLRVVTASAKQTLPAILVNVDTTMSDVQLFAQHLKRVEIDRTVARADSVLAEVNQIMAGVNAGTGTIGQLVKNPALYNSLDATIVSADSLLTDLKAHPKRYVHFSLFGKKDKEPKKKVTPLTEEAKEALTNSK